MDLQRQSLTLGQRPALILVDMIHAFTDPTCPLGTECPEVVQANFQLLQAFRARQLPVFFSTVVFHAPEQGRVFRQRVPALNVLTPDSHWVQVDARLAPLEGEAVVTKQGASAFFGTELASLLQQSAADSTVITGLTTSGCVRATVIDAMQHNYPVQVPKEAVGDRNPAAHQANLFDLHAKYADVVSLDHILTQLSQTESH
ncbi:isochorismatase family protein [Alkalimonas sp.]|uniref:isochorismatase family protein n=1 Tax=Alkalimonas sp. TaxID=1872453 RepID=UPI00263B22AC|nr:isochorismatase family protein [Alkalimonas sp.]MCC5825036.1 isochorismatase family protein [Alkalimonas sp.]